MRPKVRGRFEPFSDREIEELLVGDLAPERVAEIERAARERPELQAHLDERRAEQRAFYMLNPVLRRSPTAAPTRRLWLPFGAVAVASAAALLLYVSLPDPSGESGGSGPPGATGPGVVRAKGAPKVELTVLRGERTFVHRKGVLLREGDRVRLTLESAEPGWLTLLGQDSRGTVSIYHQKTHVAAGTFTLPGSLELDDTVGVERWYAVMTDAPAEAAALAAQLRRGERLHGRVAVVEIVKEATP